MASAQYGNDIGSEFESDTECKEKKKKHKDLHKDAPSRKTGGVASRQEAGEEYNKEERRLQRPAFISMDAYARHKKLVNDYLLFYGGQKSDFKRDTSRDRTDCDVLREHHKFLWDDDDELDTWEKRLAKKYYDKLFKEYCLTDLSRYKENKIAMRWRMDKEVIEGKGQFSCGNKKCLEAEGLKSWEVNFAYVETGEKKNALVKLRLCPGCSYKLNYHRKRREIVPQKRKKSHSISNEPGEKVRRREDEEDQSPGDAQTDLNTETKGEAKAKASAAQSVWEGPVTVDEEKSREDEFDDYLSDMLL